MRFRVCGVLVGVGLLAAAPPGSAAPVKLPEKLETSTGNFITLYRYVGPTSKSRVASADVEICTSAHTPAGTEAYPPFFQLALRGGTTVHVSPTAARSPALKITPLGPKQCVRGWISFAVPPGAKVSALAYVYATPIRWKLA
jgi:hypothetical protein